MKNKGLTNRFRREFCKMKKIGIIASLSLILMLIMTATALASATSGPHGSFTTNTNGCAACHKTHTAQGKWLISSMAAGSQNDVYRVCMYCHQAGVGSHYDEANGQIMDSTTTNSTTSPSAKWATSAGGFNYMPGIEGAAALTTTSTVTSNHSVANSNGTTQVVPGGYASGGIELRCDSCHDPHGSTNDRLLVPSVKILSTTGQTISVNTVSSGRIGIAVANALTNETVIYQDDNMSSFCGACHTDFFNTSALSGENTSGSYTTGLYRHRVNMSWNSWTGSTPNSSSFMVLPLGAGNGGTDVTCITCHFAHGTSVSVTNYTSATAGVRPATLLRMDERGVCQNCHLKQTGAAPTITAAPSTYQVDKTHLVVTFSGYLDPATATNTANYSITTLGAPSAATLQPTAKVGKQVLLTIGSTSVTSYTLTVTGVKDLNGTTITTGNTFTWTGQ